MKETICTVAGLVGGFIATLLGGWDSALSTLVIFMGVDFVTGVVTAAMGKSKHSDSGTLNSKAGWVGLAKKFCIYCDYNKPVVERENVFLPGKDNWCFRNSHENFGNGFYVMTEEHCALASERIKLSAGTV